VVGVGIGGVEPLGSAIRKTSVLSFLESENEHILLQIGNN
jgi:hypothetical protein